MDDYEIQSLDNRYTYYYKKISDLELIPNLVYDLSSFINAVISASFISFEERKEKEQIGRFRRDANDFFKKLVDEKHLKTNSYIHEGLSLIKFSAVVQMKCGMALVNYVTGSNDSNFILSLGKSNLNYDMVEKHSINRYVKQKITLMDDTTKIIQSARVIPYLSVLDSKEGRVNLKWKDKDRIKEMIELP